MRPSRFPAHLVIVHRLVSVRPAVDRNRSCKERAFPREAAKGRGLHAAYEKISEPQLRGNKKCSAEITQAMRSHARCFFTAGCFPVKLSMPVDSRSFVQSIFSANSASDVIARTGHSGHHVAQLCGSRKLLLHLEATRLSSGTDGVPSGGVLIPIGTRPWKEKEHYMPWRHKTTIGRSSQREIHVNDPDGLVAPYGADSGKWGTRAAALEANRSNAHQNRDLRLRSQDG